MTVTGKSEFVKLVEKYKSIYPFTHPFSMGWLRSNCEGGGHAELLGA